MHDHVADPYNSNQVQTQSRQVSAGRVQRYPVHFLSPHRDPYPSFHRGGHFAPLMHYLPIRDHLSYSPPLRTTPTVPGSAMLRRDDGKGGEEGIDGLVRIDGGKSVKENKAEERRVCYTPQGCERATQAVHDESCG